MTETTPAPLDASLPAPISSLAVCSEHLLRGAQGQNFPPHPASLSWVPVYPEESVQLSTPVPGLSVPFATGEPTALTWPPSP